MALRGTVLELGAMGPPPRPKVVAPTKAVLILKMTAAAPTKKPPPRPKLVVLILKMTADVPTKKPPRRPKLVVVAPTKAALILKMTAAGPTKEPPPRPKLVVVAPTKAVLSLKTTAAVPAKEPSPRPKLAPTKASGTKAVLILKKALLPRPSTLTCQLVAEVGDALQPCQLVVEAGVVLQPYLKVALLTTPPLPLLLMMVRAEVCKIRYQIYAWGFSNQL